MTRQGYDAIVAEIDRLWHEERPMVTAEVSAAAEMGDRSENAAYIYGKKRLRAIDSRLRYLRRKVEQAQPVDVEGIPAAPVIKWGAVVEIEDAEGGRRCVRLVDKEESDPAAGLISVQSPVGQALLGKEEGDVVTVRRPKGDLEYEILALRYGVGPP